MKARVTQLVTVYMLWSVLLSLSLATSVGRVTGQTVDDVEHSENIDPFCICTREYQPVCCETKAVLFVLARNKCECHSCLKGHVVAQEYCFNKIGKIDRFSSNR